MPRRRRWIPVKGTGNRIYAPGERILLGALDLPGRLLSAILPAGTRASVVPRRVLVLRLDRIGDLLMSLPALTALRKALPEAEITLAIGPWSAEIAAPVDKVLLWRAPWVDRTRTGGLIELVKQARSLRKDPPDLAIDLQGDIRASLLMALTGAGERVGYANTGGAYLLTKVVPLDETVSWVDQNLRAVGVALGAPPASLPLVDPLTPEERAAGKKILERFEIREKPVIGIHPNGGRPVKEWAPSRWAGVGRRLAKAFGGAIVVTGGPQKDPIASALVAELPGALDLSGSLSLRETLALIANLDLFLSPDTGPMHMACALGTPSVAVFGPTDPVRYFSGTPGSQHVVVRHDLWCSPCNLVRKPPHECRVFPECLRLVTEDDVFREAEKLLRSRGFDRRAET